MDKIRDSVCSIPPSSPFPLNQAFHLCLSFPCIVFHQNVPMIAHSSPRVSPTSSRSTHRHYQRIAPILNSLPTYSCSTVSTTSVSSILQYSADIIYTEPHNLPHNLHRLFLWQEDRITLLPSLRNRNRASAVGAQQNIHHATSSD